MFRSDHIPNGSPDSPSHAVIPYVPAPMFGYADGAAAEMAPTAGGLDVGRLLRKYVWLVLLLLPLGIVGGVFAVVLETPVYKARTMLEVLGASGARGALDGENYEVSATNIATQIRLLQSSAFLRGVMERLQSETVPPAPTRTDLFSKLRSRIRPETQDPLTIMHEGLTKALETYDVRLINGTRLIEIDCESTNPEIASNFVNTLASEYVEENNQSRTQSAQKAGQWTQAQLEEARINYQEAERKLQEFVTKSGLTFVGQEDTLADMKLRQLKGDLAASQAERIAKQTRYEMVKNASPEALPNILADSEVISTLQQKLREAQRNLAMLGTRLTPANPRMMPYQVQVDQLQEALNREVTGAVERIRNEYETALRKERLQTAAYAAQSGQVAAQAGKANDYNALKREVEIAKQAHSALLLQASQANLSNTVPISNMRVVDPSTPSSDPYKPRPPLIIGLGAITSMFFTVGIIFLREKLDRSVNEPGQLKTVMRARELGVIPSVDIHTAALKPQHTLFRLGKGRQGPLEGVPDEAFAIFSGENSRTELVAWNERASIVTESFRSTLASLMRENGQGQRPQVILVSSPNPGEGKTTIVSNLGIALSETGWRVLMIDADFRRPRLHQIFQVPSDWGVSSLLEEEMPVSSYVASQLAVPTAMPRLYVLPSGPPMKSVQRAVYSRRLPEIIQAMRGHFDVVLIDAPPLLPFADGRVMARYTDGVVLVIRAGMTEQAEAFLAYERLQEDGTTFLGTILNDWKPTKSNSSYYNNYYYRDRDAGRESGQHVSEI
jgi:polysaccharide biosynthesis transport protein